MNPFICSRSICYRATQVITGPTSKIPLIFHSTQKLTAPTSPPTSFFQRSLHSSPAAPRPSSRKSRLRTRALIMPPPLQTHRPSSSSSSPHKPPPTPPRPSASVLLLSPTNEILLLHRVQTSSSFPSAHVFPGGNVSPFHEPPLPPAPDHHADAPAYRLAAIRETFEESGILLTTRPPGPSSPSELDAARKAVHADTLHFPTWVTSTLRTSPCVDDLVPFTRWITPAGAARRFTTQMYLYFMPFSAHHEGGGEGGHVVDVPTHDGGVEHTAATFAAPGAWLARQARGEIVLFPPQLFLLTLVARVFEQVASAAGGGRRDEEEVFAAQRRALLEYVTRAPGDGTHPTAAIPWTAKVMSPVALFTRTSDRRIVLGLDKPGVELEGSGRGGDFERVVLVNFKKEGPRNVEVMNRDEVLKEDREAQAKKISDERASKL